MIPRIDLRHGDCCDVLPTLPAQSVDAVITDPPYPCVKRRDYGYWTEAEWWTLLVERVIPEVQRVLKPRGSAVFILRPNSERVGQIRGWLWEFMAWVCRDWNMVQDIWWWNPCTIPSGVCIPKERGLTRESVKACVWCGPPDCHRDQEAILWEESQRNAMCRATIRCENRRYPSDNHKTEAIYQSAPERGGVTPYNLLPIPNGNSSSSAGAYGYPSGTPLKLATWWTRYIVPPGGTVLDPFNGAGTMGLAALLQGCSYIGIEKEARGIDITRQRIA